MTGRLITADAHAIAAGADAPTKADADGPTAGCGPLSADADGVPFGNADGAHSAHADEALSADADEAPEAEDERGPLRRCIVTRTQGERARMIRFVVGPDGEIVPDLAARLPGRGLWLSARRDVLQTACAKGAFPRAARRSVTVSVDLAERIETGLTIRMIETLGLARRAGQAVAGFTKAREWLQGGRAGLIVQASDGSADEAARMLSGAPDGFPVIRPLTAARLGGVFGRDHVVHVAVSAGRLAETLAIEAERLAGMTGALDTTASAQDAGRASRPSRRRRGADEAPVRSP